MTVEEFAANLSLRCIAGEQGLTREVQSIYCCDLLSIAMGRAPADSLWVTVMGNANTIAVASLADVACVVLAEGVAMDDLGLEKANEHDIPVLLSTQPVFETALSAHVLL